MAKSNTYSELPEEIREQLNSVMQPGEELRIQLGAQGRVVLNESSVGNPQNRLEPDHVDVIRNLLDGKDVERGPVQVKESTGNPKTPQIEITAVSRDEEGKASSRMLLRQERDLTVSVHPADLEVTSPQVENGQTPTEEAQDENKLPQPATPSSFQQSLIDNFGASPDEAEKVARQHDFLVEEIKDSVIAPEPMTSTVQRFSEVLSQTDIHPGAQDSIVAYARNHFESVYLKAAEAQRGLTENSPIPEEAQDKNELPQPEANIDSGAPTITDARPERSPAPYRIPSGAIPQQKIFTPGTQNTLKALERSVDKLPESKTKALWQRVSADFSAIGDTAKRLGKTVTEIPTAIKADTSTLVSQGKQRVEAVKQAVSTRIQQTSPEDVMGAALKGVGIAAAAGSTQLGKASRYLQNRAEKVQNRAEKVRDHGMAKSALAIYEKGHERTGENQFKASGYTVEAVTNGFMVRNKDHLIMSFGTDAKGRPISVTKTNAATPEDAKALNQLSKADVIKGSPEAERSYENRVSEIALTARAVVEEKGEAVNGKHYFVDMSEDGSLEVITQTMPRRSLEMGSDGSIKSTLTQADLKQFETSIANARQATKPREQMTV